MKYDYVKGYKAPLNSLPKEIREIVSEKMRNTIRNETVCIDDLIIEVDLYVSVDIKNHYLRSE